MNIRKPLLAAVCGTTLLSTPLAARADEQAPSADVIRQAVGKSLALFEKSTAEYRKQRTCFSCHHQAMPVIALAEARRRGFPIDAENFQAQLDRTAEHLARNRDNYRKGRGQGGQADTAGYALWTLQAGGRKPDETTAAVAEYLLLRDGSRDHWRSTSNRPPSEASDVTTTAVSILGLQSFATESQTDRVEERLDKARDWLSDVEPKDNEDRVFRLFALYYLDEPDKTEDAIDRAVKELLDTQQDDGGWRQNEELQSDAYATGSALVALHQAGGLPVSDPAYQKGLKFLIHTQLEDGSWHVQSRSRPFQTYFESGFPHGKDQFISISASCWATTALLLTLPESPSTAAALETDAEALPVEAPVPAPGKLNKPVAPLLE